MKGSKITSLLLTCAMLLSLVVIPASAAEGDLLISPNPTTQEAAFPDVADHWGKGSVERWAGYGVLKGDETGAFNPDKQMTRAEFATMLVNLMGYTEKAENSFADVKDGDWYADAILKLAVAGIMKGDGVNANPNAPISREETAVLLCRAMNIQPSPNASVDFADKDQVASWAQDAVAALSERGMINGMGDNQFAPALEITRASVAKMVDNMVAAYVVDGTQELTGEIKGVVIIAADSDVTIKDATLSENVIVAPKAANATVALTGKTVAQDVILSAASASVSVEKDAAAGAILVEAPKGTVSVAGKADSVMTGEAGSEATVSVAKGATVDSVSLSGKDAKLDVTGSVKEVQVSSTASNTEVVANSGAKIDKMETSADNVAVSGKGTIKDMTVTGGEGVEVSKDTKVDKIENKGDAPVDVGGKPVEPGKDTSNQGGSSSGGSSGGNTPSVTYKYNVTIGSVTGGTVTTDLSGNHTNDANKEVTLTVTPDQGWKLKALTVTVPGGAVRDLEANMKFTMDKEGTYTVNATFVQPLTKFEVKVFGVADDAFKWLTDTMGFKLSPEQYNTMFGPTIDPDHPWLFIAGKRGDGMTTGFTANNISFTFNGAVQSASWGSYKNEKDGTANVLSLFVDGSGADGKEDELNFKGAAATIEVSVKYEGVTYTASCEYKAPGVTTTYKLTFTDPAGKNDTITYIVAKDGTQTAPAAPARTGYTFKGWKQDGADTTVAASAEITNITADAAYTAQWTANRYTINYDPNGNTEAQVQGVGTYDVDVTLGSKLFTRTGYTLTGWNTKMNGQGTHYDLGATVRNLVASGSITLYAEWKANTYNIAYNLNGGTNATENTATYTYGTGLTLQDPTKEGSEFLGWYTEATFENKVTAISGTDTGDRKLHALWADPQAIATRGNGPAAGQQGTDYDYAAEYAKAGFALSNGTISIDSDKLMAYVADSDNAAGITALKHEINGTDYLTYGVEYTKPAGALKVKTANAFDDLASATPVDLAEPGPAVHDGKYIHYYGIAQADGKTLDEKTFDAYVMWLGESDAVLAVNKVSVTRKTPSAAVTVAADLITVPTGMTATAFQCGDNYKVYLSGTVASGLGEKAESVFAISSFADQDAVVTYATLTNFEQDGATIKQKNPALFLYEQGKMLDDIKDRGSADTIYKVKDYTAAADYDFMLVPGKNVTITKTVGAAATVIEIINNVTISSSNG